MMPKKTKIVQPATDTNKPEAPASPATDEDKDVALEIAEEKAEPEVEIEKPKQLTREERLARMEQQIIQNAKDLNQVGEFLNRLGPLIQLSDQIAAQKQAAVENPQQQTTPLGGMQGLLPFLQMFMGQSGSQDNAFMELAKESMKADIAFTKALKSAVISKITGEATSGIARAATGT